MRIEESSLKKWDVIVENTSYKESYTVYADTEREAINIAASIHRNGENGYEQILWIDAVQYNKGL